MDISGVAGAATGINAIQLQAGISAQVMRLADELLEQLGENIAGLVAAEAGIGQNIDVSV